MFKFAKRIIFYFPRRWLENYFSGIAQKYQGRTKPSLIAIPSFSLSNKILKSSASNDMTYLEIEKN